MGYKEIVDELKRINDSNFDMDDFKSLCDLYKTIINVYHRERLENRLDASVRYEMISNRIDVVAFKKLKEKLDFDDEVISKLLLYMNYGNKINDIYIVDGNIIVNFCDKSYAKPINCLMEKEFVDISENDFVNNVNNPLFIKFLTQSLTNAIKPYINPSIEDEELMTTNHNQIVYGLDEFNIYANHTLDEILSNNDLVTRIIIKYNEELLSFDMKFHGGYIILSDTEYKINVLSEILNEKSKVMKK